MKKHNFNAGPAVLSDYAINETIKAIQDFGGLSILTISHRSKDLFRQLSQEPHRLSGGVLAAEEHSLFSRFGTLKMRVG